MIGPYDCGVPAGEYPDFRDIHERVGRALVHVLALSHRIAFKERPDGQPLHTADDLRQIRPEVLDVNDDAAPELAQVGAQDVNIWAWFRFLIAPESPTCTKPSGVADADPGRWVLQVLPEAAACATHRYFAHVEFCSAQVDNHQLGNRCRQKTPALFISPMGDDEEEAGQTMAHHRMVIRYRLRFMSANWGGGVSARMTPPLNEKDDGKPAADPGTMRMIGDTRRLLVSANTLDDVSGVVKVSLGSFAPTFEKSAERIIVDALDLRVICYVHTPNTPCEIVSPWVMWLQLQDQLGRKAGPANQVRDGG